ncbi:MAG: HEAT repeat domain-containing protein, partial [Polyangiaceae bacterium]
MTRNPAARLVAITASLWGAVAPLGCSRGPSTTAPVDGSAAPAAPSADLVLSLARAEDQRLAKDVTAGAERDHDPAVRRRAARALARILDADDTPLLAALSDDDDEVVAWAAYGLAESCRSHEEAHVRALAARLASLRSSSRGGGPVDAHLAVLRGLGRCGGDLAEQTLRAWLRREDAAPATLEAAALALGDVAARRGSLSLES